MEPSWQSANSLASDRSWLGEVQPIRYDEGLPGHVWDADCDAAIAKMRKNLSDIDALFVVAERGGIAFTPAWPGPGEIHSLIEIASTTDDTDWIIVCSNNSDGEFAAGMILNDPPYGYAPLGDCERHRTPLWSIYITMHS